MAGRMAAILYWTGIEKSGTSHSLPLASSNFIGTSRNSIPWKKGSAATALITKIVNEGPKSASHPLTCLLKNLPLYVCTNLRARAYVVRARFRERRGTVLSAPVFANLARSPLPDSNKKLYAKRALNTSSVNCVQNLMTAVALVDARRKRNREVQSPVQVYRGRNGMFWAVAALNRAVVKARVRPVGPMKAIGWPAMAAKTIPAPPHATKNSGTPTKPPVTAEVIPPKATAGARQAKYMKMIDDMDLGVNPSIQSEA
mmetsp:Transcript_39754/g.78305  ORF Transcript_39754/g.78305 Transcript_39754/m.78305 type:complete len:257 (-) Transcript_39754:496-1266(-)